MSDLKSLSDIWIFLQMYGNIFKFSFMHLKEYLFRCNPEEGTAMWLSLMAIQMFVPSLTLNPGLAMRIAVSYFSSTIASHWFGKMGLQTKVPFYTFLLLYGEINKCFPNPKVRQMASGQNGETGNPVRRRVVTGITLKDGSASLTIRTAREHLVQDQSRMLRVAKEHTQIVGFFPLKRCLFMQTCL